MISDKVEEAESFLYGNIFKELDKIEFLNKQKVLKAFVENRVAEHHLKGTTGYGHNDIGREALEKVYASAGNFNMISEIDFELYCTKWYVGKEKLKEIITAMRELNLFPEDSFNSKSVKERIKRIQSERKRHRNYKRNNALRENIFNAENTVKTPVKQSYYTLKEKESKVK